MIRKLIPSLLLCTVVSFPVSASAVTFDWALVGNAGNAPDPETGFGAVSYDFAISKHEVTNAQYTAFLNAVDPYGTNELSLYYFTGMAGDEGGIENNGLVDGARYVAKPGREQNPVTYVAFTSAMRFTNWLHNGQGDGGTETGAYAIMTIGDVTRPPNGQFEVRSSDARYWIPSEDEWYKAAYHDASAGTAGVYFDYATGSDNVPVSDHPGDDPSAVNYFNDDGLDNGFNDGLAVSGSLFLGPNQFTDVGAYTDAASPYGTFDQNGNAWEWNEAIVDSTLRGNRGGSWVSDATGLEAGARIGRPPIRPHWSLGFRVAAIPEPTTMLMGCFAAIALMIRRRN